MSGGGTRAGGQRPVPSEHVGQFFRHGDPRGLHEIERHQAGDVGNRKRVAGREFARRKLGIEELQEQGYVVDVNGVPSGNTALLTTCTVTSIQNPGTATPNQPGTTTVSVDVACPIQR